MKSLLPSILLVAMPIIVGCQNESQTESDTGRMETERTSEERPDVADPKSRAMAAKETLRDRLSTRLIQAMSNGGPAAAIEVCSKEAPELAAEVGQECGVQIGRTSFRLRNPKNAPPEWAGPAIDERRNEPVFVDLPDGHLGALFPIKLAPQCLTCHGPKDQIAPEILAALAAGYPDDQATGFNTDDLRGWFWVDVPE